MKERWFNYRPICLACAFLMLGSLFAFYLTKNLALVIGVASIVFILLLILALFKKKYRYLTIPLTAFALGVVCYNVAVKNFETDTQQPSVIEARISSMGKPYDNYIKIEADNCVFDGAKEKHNINVILYDNSGLYENLEVGSIIKFSPIGFYKNELFSNETPNTNLFNKDLRFTAVVNVDDINILGLDKTLAETFKQSIKENLSLSLTNENVEIAYSCLFGDKQLLSDNQYSAYKLSGIAHLLAVSGLHVGIIVLVIGKILEGFKIKRWGKLAILSAFLGFYMYICNFSVSVIRASIMAIILLLSKILREEYDSFNSIAIAGIVIYFINPLCIFDISFLMSFSCALGIAMLYTPILRAISKTKVNTKLVESVSISLATTISLVVIMAFFFRTLNIISILANVILIPIFTLAFIPTFIISMLSFIPYLGYVFYPLNYVFTFINLCATLLGNLAISNFSTIPINFIAIVLYFILIVFMGRLCSAKYQYKIAVTLPILALLFCCML